MTENIEPTPASAISKLSDMGELIERALVSEDELTREVGAIALELTQATCKAAAREIARKSEDAHIRRLKAENDGLRELVRSYRAMLASNRAMEDAGWKT